MATTEHQTAPRRDADAAQPTWDQASCRLSPHAVFTECPQCGGEMQPEHAHYRCSGCGWRDSCCD